LATVTKSRYMNKYLLDGNISLYTQHINDQQEPQVSQRDRAMLLVIKYFA